MKKHLVERVLEYFSINTYQKFKENQKNLNL